MAFLRETGSHFRGKACVHLPYPARPACGTEHARQGAGGQYDVHLKDSSGREARVSTESWKPLTPEDAAKMTRQMQNTAGS